MASPARSGTRVPSLTGGNRGRITETVPAPGSVRVPHAGPRQGESRRFPALRPGARAADSGRSKPREPTWTVRPSGARCCPSAAPGVHPTQQE